MRRRRWQGPPALPPPLRGIVIDGSNVIASGSGRATLRLDVAVAWFQQWRPDLPVQVFVDAATVRRCRPDVQDELRTRYAVTPPGESADLYVLRHAREHGALVLSNDRFFDHDEARKNVVTVQFTLAGDTFAPFDEATWFRSPGTAQRVPMATLQLLR